MLTRATIPDWILKDPELAGGVWLLTSPLIADKAVRYLNLETTSRNAVVNWERLAKETRGWSHGERIYVEVALHLWTGNDLPDFAQPYRWGATLDPANRTPLLEAIAFVLTGVSIAEERVRIQKQMADVEADLYLSNQLAMEEWTSSRQRIAALEKVRDAAERHTVHSDRTSAADLVAALEALRLTENATSHKAGEVSK